MASIATLQSVAATLNADCVILREKLIEDGRKAAQCLVRQKADEKVTFIQATRLKRIPSSKLAILRYSRLQFMCIKY